MFSMMSAGCPRGILAPMSGFNLTCWAGDGSGSVFGQLGGIGNPFHAWGIAFREASGVLDAVDCG